MTDALLKFALAVVLVAICAMFVGWARRRKPRKKQSDAGGDGGGNGYNADSSGDGGGDGD